MAGINDKNTIKTPYFLQISHFWTLLTFVINQMEIMMAGPKDSKKVTHVRYE